MTALVSRGVPPSEDRCSGHLCAGDFSYGVTKGSLACVFFPSRHGSRGSSFKLLLVLGWPTLRFGFGEEAARGRAAQARCICARRPAWVASLLVIFRTGAILRAFFCPPRPLNVCMLRLMAARAEPVQRDARLLGTRQLLLVEVPHARMRSEWHQLRRQLMHHQQHV